MLLKAAEMGADVSNRRSARAGVYNIVHDCAGVST